MSTVSIADIRILEKRKNDLSRDIETLARSRKDQLDAINKQVSTARIELDAINEQITEGKNRLRVINEVIQKKISITEAYVKKITDNSIVMANKRIHVADSIRERSFFPKK